MISVLVFDPGESTGWVFRDRLGNIVGGTAGKNHEEVAQLIQECEPDVLVFERFNLYPSMAKSLAWNSFYPCEVIGVIKYACMGLDIPIVEQAPSVKKYSGKTDKKTAGMEWDNLEVVDGRKTEHTWDAYQHLKYFEKVGEKKFK